MKIVEVSWIDSTALADGWRDKQTYIEMSNLECTTVGYLIYESDDIIVLAMSHNPENDDVNHCYTIPRVCVKEMKEIGSVL
jgi:hypothetical protein